MQLFCRGTVVPAHSVSPISDSRSAQRVLLSQSWRDAGAGDAPNDGRVALSALAFFRCLPAGVSASGVSRQWHSTAVGQHEPGIRPLSAVGGFPAFAHSRCAVRADAEIADFGDAGRQTRAPVLLPL